MKNMTAKVSCFSRAYHYKNNDTWVFKDSIADKILGDKEYNEISINMSNGIQFFNPGFNGSQDEALQHIVDYHLSPSVLGRSAFCEMHLKNELQFGCTQYVIFGSGYDTYAIRETKLLCKVFELDLPDMILDKQDRLTDAKLISHAKMIACDLTSSTWRDALIQNSFNPKERTLGSLLGISYYLSKEEFSLLLQHISEIWSEGSSICIDYPVIDEGEKAKKTRQLANGANEQMKAKYDYFEMEELLENAGFLVYEHLDEEMMTEMFFENYNKITSKHIVAPKGVHYILATKK